MHILPRSFYARSPLVVAPELLGKVVMRQWGGQMLSGRIVEVEAYLAGADEASHAYAGQTKRNASLYLDAGHAYVYQIHQQHCLDVVTEGVGTPTSVLIRALEPLDGVDIMRKRRNKDDLRQLTSGPGKLCQALGIDGSYDSIDLTDPSSPIWIVSDDFPTPTITTSPRIGISRATEHEYRFYVAHSTYISRK